MAEDKDKVAARAAEDRRAAVEKRNAAIDDRVREGREAMAARNAPILEKEGGAVKPTPTPEEIDAAVLGHHIANKEDDGSGPDPHLRRLPVDGSAPYATRDMQATQRDAMRPGQPSGPSTSDAGVPGNVSSASHQSGGNQPGAQKDGDKRK